MIRKELVYAVTVMLFTSFIAMAAGIVLDNFPLIIGGITVAGLALVMRFTRLRCPKCRKPFKLGGLIDKDTVTCRLCNKETKIK